MPQPIYLPGPQPNPFLNFLNQAAIMMISHNLGMKRQEAYLEAQKDIAEIEKKYTLSVGGYTKEPPSTKKMSEEELDKAIAGKMQPIKVGTEAFWAPPAPELPEELRETHAIVYTPGKGHEIIKKDIPSIDERIKEAFARVGMYTLGGRTYRATPEGLQEIPEQRQFTPQQQAFQNLGPEEQRAILMRGMELKVLPDGTVIFGQGPKAGGGFTQPVQTELQKEVPEMIQQYMRVMDIGSEFVSDFLTYGGKLKEKGLIALDKVDPSLLGGEQREFLQRMNRFRQNVEMEFAAFRKRTTGAQAALQELEYLMKATMSMKLSPSQFEASWNRYRGALARAIRTHIYLDTTGQFPRGSEQWGRFFDSVYTGSEDPIDLLGNTLKQQGMSDDEIVQKLRQTFGGVLE